MKIKIVSGWKGSEVAIGEVKEGRCEIVTATGREISYASPQDLLMAYPPPRYWVLSEPDNWELAKDPFHPEAFVGTPAEGAFPEAGPRSVVWLALDWWGNAVGIAGVRDLHPQPPDYPHGKGFTRPVECEVCEEGFMSDCYQEAPVCPKCQETARVEMQVLIVGERMATE